MALEALFFYGTLRHIPLLELVLGRSRSDLQLTPAELPDHKVYWVKKAAFPMIVEEPGARATGLLLRAPTKEDVARLNYYEGGFAYDLREVTALDAANHPHMARVFFPEAGHFTKGHPWVLADWERDWLDITLIAAQEAIAHFGQWSAQDLASKLPMMRMRAATMLTARDRQPTKDHCSGADQVEVLSQERVHSNFFALDRMVVRQPQYDGTISEPLNREVFFAGHAVVLLPYDPVRDEVILVQQFRVNMYALGDPSPWMVEAVAGLIDPGETPEEAGIREAIEEAGVHARHLELVSAAYSSTGSNTEFVTCYVALADFSELGQGGGLDTEGEDIRRLVLPFDEFAEGLLTQRFRDAPLNSTGFWLMLNRERLRGSA